MPESIVIPEPVAITGPVAVPLLITLGESMARFSATDPGPMRLTRGFDLGIAGAESNVAIGFRRLGGEAAWIGRVGDDEFGRLILATLRAEGVTAAAAIDPDAPTGLLFKEQRTATHARVVYRRADSAGSRLRPEDLDLAAIRRASLLHVTGITPALSADAAQACAVAVAAAVDAETMVSIDVNHRIALWGGRDAAAALEALCARAGILFATVAEAQLLLGTASADAESLAVRLHERYGAEAVVKLGAAGALAADAAGLHRVTAYEVEQIDPVGAGDAFASGYLLSRARGDSVDDALDLGARCGAFAVGVHGDWEGLPTLADLALLGGHDIQR